MILSEDGAEVFLEYFWVDKYIIRKDWLVKWNSILMGTIALSTLSINILTAIIQLDEAKNQQKPSQTWPRCLTLILNAIGSVIFSVASLIRVISNLFSFYTNRISERCYNLTDFGAVVQQPFDKDCMSSLDYVMLACTLVPIFLFVIHTGILLRNASKQINPNLY